jgi:pterin-4a-carbinolamine dehydratase
MAQPMEDKTPVAGGELQEALKELDGWVISITKRFRFEKWATSPVSCSTLLTPSLPPTIIPM